MKLLKRIIKAFTAIILLLFVAILVILNVDKANASYLDIRKTADSPDSFIITHVNIVPMRGDTVLTDHSILITDGRIEKIDRTIEEAGPEVVDGNGMFLSPGLIDMHVHVWDSQELGLYLANGVTTVRNAWGIPFHLRLKRQIGKNNIYSPLFFTTSPKLTGPQDPGDDKVQVSGPDQARKLVRRYRKKGYDCIKTYAGLPKDILDAVIDEAAATDMMIVSHPSREVPYLEQFRPRVVSLEHAEEIVQQPLDYQLDSAGLELVVSAFANTNTSFCPTLTGYYKIFEMLDMETDELPDGHAPYMNPLMRKFDSKVQFSRWANEKNNNPAIRSAVYRQHRFHLYIVREMNIAGVNIICGTDAGIGITEPGFSIHEELAFYQEAGLSNYEALATATINPSKTHKEFQSIGSIENGKWANFNLTKENPLENLNTLKAPELVVIEGQKIGKDQLTGFTRKAASRKNLLATAFRYAEYLFVER